MKLLVKKRLVIQTLFLTSGKSHLPIKPIFSKDLTKPKDHDTNLLVKIGKKNMPKRLDK